MNDIRTRVHTAALIDALQLVRTEADAHQYGFPNLDKAIDDALVKADEAHACALDDAEEADRYQKYTEMTSVAKEYYTLLDAGKQAPDEVRAKLDILLEPFSDDPAFTAFCQMKRAAAGLS